MMAVATAEMTNQSNTVPIHTSRLAVGFATNARLHWTQPIIRAITPPTMKIPTESPAISPLLAWIQLAINIIDFPLILGSCTADKLGYCLAHFDPSPFTQSYRVQIPEIGIAAR